MKLAAVGTILINGICMSGERRRSVKNKINNKSNITLTVLLIVLLAIITVVLVKLSLNSGTKTIDFSRYLNYGFSGLNGRGTVTFSLDESALNEVLTEGEKNAVLIRRLEAMVSGMELKVSKDKDLSNGEIIDVTIEYDTQTAGKLKCHFKNSTLKVQVYGLEEGTEIDIFSKVDVIVAGISPNAYASVANNWTDDALENLKFTLDKTNGISLGDVLTVTCIADDNVLDELGITVSSWTLQFKVDRLDAYIQSFEELDLNTLRSVSDSCISTIKQETEDMTFRMLYKASKDSAYLFQYNNEWVNSVELVEADFLVKNASAGDRSYNYVEMLYKANIGNDLGDADVYFAFEFTPVIRSADGSFVMDASNLSKGYVCGMDYNELYGQVVLSKEGLYDIYKVEALAE